MHHYDMGFERGHFGLVSRYLLFIFVTIDVRGVKEADKCVMSGMRAGL